MSSKRSILNKVASMIDKRAQQTNAGKSYHILLDDEPEEIIRSRGAFNDSNNLQPSKAQTEEQSNE